MLVLLFSLALAHAPRAGCQPIVLDTVSDGILLSSGVVLAGVSEYLARTSPDRLGKVDSDLINPLDRLLMPPYSREIDIASDIFQAAALTMPLVFFLIMEPAQATAADVVCIEALSIAYGAKNLAKYLIPRYRPYLYTGGASGVDPWDDDQSFPSGHATMAFAAASVCTLMFAQHFPGSPYVVPFAVLNYGIATLTASLRVAAGVHFLTDAIAGAALGTVLGYAVPLARKRS